MNVMRSRAEPDLTHAVFTDVESKRLREYLRDPKKASADARETADLLRAGLKRAKRLARRAPPHHTSFISSRPAACGEPRAACRSKAPTCRGNQDWFLTPTGWGRLVRSPAATARSHWSTRIAHEPESTPNELLRGVLMEMDSVLECYASGGFDADEQFFVAIDAELQRGYRTFVSNPASEPNFVVVDPVSRNVLGEFEVLHDAMSFVADLGPDSAVEIIDGRTSNQESSPAAR